MEWTSVDEKLPESYKDVLIYGACNVEIGYFRSVDGWHVYYGDDVIETTVSHWMPLPCPPEGN